MRALVLTASQEDVSARALARALSRAHEVVEFDYARAHTPLHGTRLRRVSSTWRWMLHLSGLGETAIADRALLQRIKGQRFDLVLILRPTLVPPEVVATLARQTGAIVIGWFMDAIVNLEPVAFLTAPYHALFFKDRLMVEHLRRVTRLGFIDYLPQAFDPELHRPVDRSSRFARCDVATYGNGYPYRAFLLEPLLSRNDINTVVYGRTGWRTPPRLRARYQPAVWGREKSEAMRASSIALNTNHYAELDAVNKRTFELCGMGTCQLTNGVAVTRYFEPDREIATFNGPHELVERVRHLLDHPDERAAIARQGLARAWREHTWAHRLNEMFQRIPALRGVTRLPTPIAPPIGGEGLDYTPARNR